MPKNMQTYLNFKLDDHNVLVSIHDVLLVLALPALQSVPDSEPSFRGILNYHGKGVPIYDLLYLVSNKDRIHKHPDIPIVLIDVSQHIIGFLVTSVEGLLEINEEDIQDPQTKAMPYVRGSYETEDKNAWVLGTLPLIRHFNLNHYIGKGDE